MPCWGQWGRRWVGGSRWGHQGDGDLPGHWECLCQQLEPSSSDIPTDMASAGGPARLAAPFGVKGEAETSSPSRTWPSVFSAAVRASSEKRVCGTGAINRVTPHTVPSVFHTFRSFLCGEFSPGFFSHDSRRTIDGHRLWTECLLLDLVTVLQINPEQLKLERPI